jgi:lipoate-protein ligase A
VGAVRETGARPRRRALSTPWRVERRAGTPAVLHESSAFAPAQPGRLLRVCQVLSPAIVLGSAQPVGDVDAARCRAAALDVVRRHSGGGAVLVLPGCQLWVDAFLPRDDPLFVEDVSRSFLWLGEAWRDAISTASPATPRPSVLNRNPPHPLPLTRVLCFVGAVRGEVFAGGRKIVGLAQRRRREGAWFHSMALLEHAPGLLAGVLSGSDEHRRLATEALATGAAALDDGRTVARRLEQVLLERIVAT